MSCNLIKEYADFNKQNFEEYTKRIMDKYYDENIFNKYIEKYNDIRYYNEEPEIRATLEYNLNHYLSKIYEKEPSVVSEFIQKLFVLYYYLDDVVDFNIQKDLANLVDLINNIREEKVGIIDENFIKEFTELIQSNLKRKKEFIDKFDSHEFYLDLNKVPNTDIYIVKLKHEIKIPKLYSRYAINKIWETKQISENKIKIEYYLLNQVILKDIIQGIYNDSYLIDFEISLLENDNKVNSLLNIMNNDIAKDLITIKINFTDFTNNKDKILSLIKEGYQFALIIDDNYTIDNNNILDIFRYIIIEKEEYMNSNMKERKNILVLE